MAADRLQPAVRRAGRDIRVPGYPASRELARADQTLAQLSLAIVASPDAPDLLGWIGVGLGVALACGSLEFVGRPGPRGWSIAERVVPIAYVGWSVWLFVLGVALVSGVH